MAQKHSEERRMLEMTELGKRNAQLMPKVRNWCQHLDVKLVTSGLLAQMSGLPIGMLAITCPHASAGGIQSMHLDEVASSFIIHNCRGCPHHKPVSLDNVGYTILEEFEKLKRKPQPATPTPHPARVRLHQLVRGDLTAALKQAPTTVQSVLELVALLEDPQQHTVAAERLVGAAKVAPELFNDLALEVLCSHFPDHDHGKHCMECIEQLRLSCNQHLDLVWEAALACIELGKNADAACRLIGNQVRDRQLLPLRHTIDRIIAVQYHVHQIGVAGRPEYPGSNHALIEIGRQAPDVLANLFEIRLDRGHKSTRINASRTVEKLVKTLPSLGQGLLPPLIMSLELDDDPYMDSADGAACNTISEIFKLAPDATQRQIADLLPKISAEAQGTLFGIYRRIVLDANRGDSEAQQCVRLVLEVLLNVISSTMSSAEVVDAATDALELAGKYALDEVIPHLDALLGSLAILAANRTTPTAKKPRDQLEALEEMNRRNALGACVRRVRDTIESIASRHPAKVLERIREILPSLSSKQDFQASYKAELVRLYGVVGRTPSLLPQIIPDLYRLLTDFDSVSVRGAAIESAGEILTKTEDALPGNMRELILSYLVDNYVHIHRAASHAVASMTPATEEEMVQAVHGLSALYQAYKKDPFFQRELARAILSITSGSPELLNRIAAPILVDLGRNAEALVADDALGDLWRLLPRLPQGWARIYAKEVLQFLRRTHRDRYGQGSTRESLLLSLYDLPSPVIASLHEEVQQAAIAKAPEDAWEASEICALLGYAEQYECAAQTAATIAKSQPQVKRSEHILHNVGARQAIYAAEAAVAAGKLEQARGLLQDADGLLRKQNADEKAHRFDEFIQTSQVAQRLAERARGIQLE